MTGPNINFRVSADDLGATALLNRLEAAIRRLRLAQTAYAKAQTTGADEAILRKTAAHISAMSRQVTGIMRVIRSLQQYSQAANQSARATVAQTNAQIANARAATAQANAQAAASRAQSAAARVSAGVARQQGIVNAQMATGNQRLYAGAGAWHGYIGSMLRLYLGYRALEGVVGFFREGMKFNQVLETGRLGIASIVVATSQVKDANGKVLDTAEALPAAYKLASDQMQKIRIAGLQTAATTEQLIDAFQSALGPGLARGLNLDQIRRFSVQVVQAAGAIGVPMHQLNQEVRSILDATIDRNSRVARVLRITNEDVRLHVQLGDLADYLNKKMAVFTEAGKQAMNTWYVLKTNIQEAAQVFAGGVFERSFQTLRQGLNSILQGVFDFQNLKFDKAIQPLVDVWGSMWDKLSASFVQGVQFMLDGAKSLAKWFTENQSAVENLWDALDYFIRSVGKAIANIAGLISRLIQWNTKTGVLSAILRQLGDLLRAFTTPAVFGLSVAIWAVNKALSAIPTKALFALAGLMTTPVGAGLLIALAAVTAGAVAWKLYDEHVRQTAIDLEIAKKKAVEHAVATDRSAVSYMKLVTELRNAGKNEKEREEILKRLKVAAEELARKDAGYAAILRDQSLSAEQAADKILKLVAAKEQAARVELQTRMAERTTLENWTPLPEKKLVRGGYGAVTEVADEDAIAINRKMAAQIAFARRQAETAAAVYHEYRKVHSELQEAAHPTATTTPNPNDDKGKDKANNDAQQRIEAEIRSLHAKTKEQEDALKESLDESAISYQSYFASLRGLREEAASEEIALLEQLRDVTTDPGEKALIGARIDEVMATERHNIHQETREYRKAQADLQKVVDDINAALLQAKGDTFAAARARAKSTFDKERERLEANGISTDQIDELDRLNAEREFMATAERRLQNIQTTLRDTIDRAKDELQAGVINRTTARNRIADAYTEADDAVVALLADLKALPELAGSPALQALLDKFTRSATTMRRETRAAMQATREFENAIADSLKGTLADFFTSSELAAGNFADAFRNMAISIIQSIQRMIAQIIAWKIVSQIFGSIAAGPMPFGLGGGSSAATTTTVGLPDGVYMAAGGLVTGPGSGTSDSVMARLSNGEYVMRAAAVESVGVEALDAINYGMRRHHVRSRTPRFADGGLVVAGPGAGGSGTLEATIGLQEGLVISHLRSRAGEAAHLEIVRRNATQIRALLGIGRRA